MIRLLHSFYKKLISPLLGNTCRFHPSCSDYFLEAVETHGILKGALLGFKRLLRCHPFSRGWIDPVPASAKATAGQAPNVNIKENLSHGR
jgi:putative membrane protein insertion efficiency factor